MAPVAAVGAGRFAPSPTGVLHLGSLVAALGSYLLARYFELRWLVRIDDLDQPRVVAGAAEQILTTLELAGFQWDQEPLWQSRRGWRYQEILDCLRQQGLLYPCSCSRREVLASAPHVGEDGPVYNRRCLYAPPQKGAISWRLRMRGKQEFYDCLQGKHVQDLEQEVGDIVLKRSDGIFAYQLATVIDDLDSGVTQVVRGCDLIRSTPRQIYLLECLQQQAPTYWHLPLLLDEKGQKISKRQGLQAQVVPQNLGLRLWQAASFLGLRPPEWNAKKPPVELLQQLQERFSPEQLSVDGEHPRQGRGAENPDFAGIQLIQR